MKYIRVLLILMVVALIFVNLNVNSAFVVKKSEELINAYNNNNLLRLHVLAASNSPRDQYIKRRTRDAVISYMARYTSLKNYQDNLKSLEGHLESYLESEGVNYPVQVELGNYYFPRRTYGDTTLPAGDYKALRVILDKGKGSNWWCVLLPPLCIENAQHQEGKDGPAGESKQENIPTGKGLSIGPESGLEFRFKFLELFKKDKEETEGVYWTERIIKKINFLFKIQQT